MCEGEGDCFQEYVCMADELAENEMKIVQIDGNKLLLIKQNGSIHALGAKCPHYGVPLERGYLSRKGRLRCGAHGACFNIETGDIEDYPGLDCLPRFRTVIENDQIKICGKKSQLIASKYQKPVVAADELNENCYIAIGGGPSSATFVETLRQNGYTGQIKMICKEKYLPYDRPKISKSMILGTIHTIELRTKEFYKSLDVDVILNTPVKAIDTENCIVKTDNAYYKYTKCYIATGCRARVLPIPGIDLENIFVMRDYDDNIAIVKQLATLKQVVILGSSFIGMETAMACTGLVAKITIVTPSKVPFEHLFGYCIGHAIKQLYEKKKIIFITNTTVQEFIGSMNRITSVLLSDGQTLKCDICILGTGIEYNTDFLKSSNINLNPDGSIPVDVRLQTNISNISAGGDVVYAPVFAKNNLKTTIQHIQLAQYHGRIAAINMIDKVQLFKAVPFFSCKLYDKNLRFVGAETSSDFVTKGSIADFKFLVIYFKENKVISMLSCGYDKYTAAFAELLFDCRSLTKKQIIADPLSWIAQKN